MSAYEELVDRACRASLNACSGRQRLPKAFVRECEVRAILAEVSRTLEDVTPEMANEWGRDWVGKGRSPDGDWLAMLRASPLVPPKDKP